MLRRPRARIGSEFAGRSDAKDHHDRYRPARVLEEIAWLLLCESSVSIQAPLACYGVLGAAGHPKAFARKITNSGHGARGSRAIRLKSPAGYSIITFAGQIRVMRIELVGAAEIGLTSDGNLAFPGHRATCVDSGRSRINQLNQPADRITLEQAGVQYPGTGL